MTGQRQRLLPCFLATALSSPLFCHASSTPAPPHYYHDQLVNHDEISPKRWSQRYYTSAQHFQGPGHPILLILGGEGAIEPPTGLYYPFVTDRLARVFGGYVLEPEHRFYGESQPVNVSDLSDPRIQTLLTPKQALQDAMRLVKHVREELQCSHDRTLSSYCPIITIGGSYPGWLSAMARLLFANVVDMAYAASAPMKFYSQQVQQGAYYERISQVAEQSKPGCREAVKHTLLELHHDYGSLQNRRDVVEAAASLGFCSDSIPNYIQNASIFRDEVIMMVGYTFANDNMANYPPDNHTRLYESCSIFMDSSKNIVERTRTFFEVHFLMDNNHTTECMDMSLQLPSGKHATISGGDWSGCGVGGSGESWDFQTCTLLVEAIGFSNESMFPPRTWSIEWLSNHCQSRFGVTPQPSKLVQEWHFDKIANHATRILFTNGLNDGWSVGGILTNLSDSVLALNFEHGAHHSELGRRGPSEDDTEDIRRGYDTIQTILGTWLDEVKGEQRIQKQTDTPIQQGSIRKHGTSDNGWFAYGRPLFAAVSNVVGYVVNVFKAAWVPKSWSMLGA